MAAPMPETSPIDFYFDYLSPYAYLAWARIHELAAAHGRSVRPVPVLLAGLLDAHGTLGPAEVPAKRTYVFKDVLRTATRLGLPLAPPPTHPFNPLLALRVSCIEAGSNVRKAVVDGLFRETWGGGRGVEDAAVVESVAAAAGLPDAVAKARSPAIKDQLKDYTARALELGMFGVPTMVSDGEIFWGLDSFPNLDQHLRGARLPSDTLERWRDLKASAGRKR